MEFARLGWVDRLEDQELNRIRGSTSEVWRQVDSVIDLATQDTWEHVRREMGDAPTICGRPLKDGTRCRQGFREGPGVCRTHWQVWPE